MVASMDADRIDTRARLFAVVYAVVLLATFAAATTLLALTADIPRPESLEIPSVPLEFADRLQFLSVGLLGAFLLPGRRDNRFVWILLVTGIGFPLWDLDEGYGRWRLQGGAVPADGLVAAWATNWVWIISAPMAGLLFLWFPDGRPPSPRWRVVSWMIGASIVGLLMTTPLFPGPLDAFPSLDNPVGIPVSPDAVERVIMPLFTLQFLGVIGGAASLVARMIWSRGAERQQVKWFASAALVFAVFTIITGPLEVGTLVVQAVAEILASVLLTIAIGVAITRHSLYEIDRILSRTLAYVLVTAVLVGIYFASVLALGAAARALTGQSGDLVVAASTLAVAAAFQPVRRRVQGFVDRRFDRMHYDAARTIDRFGRTLRDEVDTDAIVEGLQQTVGSTMGASRVGVVLIGDRG
jgi:hypothetical protein